jgi:hypothetical protein
VSRLLANEELLVAEFIPFYVALLAIILGTRLLLPLEAVEYTVEFSCMGSEKMISSAAITSAPAA